MSTSTQKILLTGGHATPAFAVLDVLLKDHPEWKYLWVSEKHNQRGTKSVSAEYITVTEKYKIPFIQLTTGKLQRSWTLSTFPQGLLELGKLFFGFFKAFYIVIRHRPTLVMSFGGFLAVPIVFWSWVFRIPVLTHEQTIVTGLANKIIGKFAKKILVSFESSKQFFNPTKVIFTGNPIRKNVFESTSHLTKDFDESLPLIYITGGNQGAHEINKRIYEIIEDLLQIANVIHQTGNSTITNDYLKAKEQQSHLPENIRKRYVVKEYISSEEIGEVFNKSDIILSRAGANSVLEVLAIGKLAIFIPIPWTYMDEQTKNAQIVVDTGLGFLLKQSKQLAAKQIYDALIFGLNNKKKNVGFNGKPLAECQQIAKSYVKLDSAEKVAEEIYTILMRNEE